MLNLIYKWFRHIFSKPKVPMKHKVNQYPKGSIVKVYNHSVDMSLPLSIFIITGNSTPDRYLHAVLIAQKHKNSDEWSTETAVGAEILLWPDENCEKIEMLTGAEKAFFELLYLSQTSGA